MTPTKTVLVPEDGLSKIIIYSVKASGNPVSKGTLIESVSRTVEILQETNVLPKVPHPEFMTTNDKIRWDVSRLAELDTSHKKEAMELVETPKKEVAKAVESTQRETSFQEAEVAGGFDITKACLVVGSACAVVTLGINAHQNDYFAWLGFPKPSSTVVVSESERVLLEDRVKNHFIYEEPQGNNLLPKKTSHTEVVQSRSWSEFFGWKK
jgi:hypothetical protein